MSKLYNKPLVFSCLILIIGLMSVDFISPSLPYIQIDFIVSQETMKNTVLIYMLILGIGQLFYGYLSDQYGRKVIILFAFIISIIGIGLSAFAKNITIFYIARVITAIGCAGCPVIARAIISDVSKDAIQLKKSFSIFSLTSQISPGIAPVIGGVIQTISSWRISLLSLMILNILCFLVLYNFMPETCKLNNRTERKKTSAVIIIYWEFFKNKYFFLMSLLSALIYVYTIGFYNMLPFVLHKINVSVITNGIISSIYAFSLAFGAFILHKFLYKLSSSKLFSRLVLIYIIYLLISLFFFRLLSQNIFVIALWSSFIGLLCGIIAPLTLSMCMQGFNKNKGIASSVQSSIKMFFTGVGLILFSKNKLVNIFQINLIFIIISIIVCIIWVFIKNLSVIND